MIPALYRTYENALELIIALTIFPPFNYDLRIFMILLKYSFDIDCFMSLGLTSSASSIP